MESDREILNEAIGRYQAALTDDVERYLEARGIDGWTSLMYRLGVVSNPVAGHHQFEGWLAIPYLRHDGEPVSIRFRCIDPACGVLYRPRTPDDPKEDHSGHGKKKYMSLEDEPARVFNVKAIHRADDVIHVCEGEFDTIVLDSQLGPAIGIPGASGWQAKHRSMLAGFSRVWVWGDPDDAGVKFTRKVCRSLRQARGVQLSRGDVTETFLAEGTAGLQRLIGE